MKAVVIAAILLTTLPGGISDATTRIEGQRRLTNSIGMTLVKIPRRTVSHGEPRVARGTGPGIPPVRAGSNRRADGRGSAPPGPDHEGLLHGHPRGDHRPVQAVCPGGPLRDRTRGATGPAATGST